MHYALSAFAAALTTIMILINGELTRRTDIYAAAVLIHLVGLALISLIAGARRERLMRISGIPWTAFLGGALGVMSTLFGNLAYGRIDVSAIVALNLLGQAVTSLVIDQYGLLGMPVARFNRGKLAGLLCAAAGIVVMLMGKAFSWLPVAVSLMTGVTLAVSRCTNAQLGARTSVVVSTWYNYVIGLIGTLIVFWVARQFGASAVPATLAFPAWTYLGGALGVIIILQSNFSTHRLPAFQMTLTLFLGQLFTGVVVDAVQGARFPAGNVVGGVLVMLGLGLNVWLDMRTRAGVWR